MLRSAARAALALVGLVLLAGGASGQDDATVPEAEAPGSGSRLSDQAAPLAGNIRRPEPLLQIGDPFLGTGPLQRGIELPGGAVWTPSLVVFGTHRTAIQSYDDGDTTYSEWANRLDLFANLQLSGTERVLVGFRPLDNYRDFVGFRTNPVEEWVTDFDGRVEMAFFEGEFGELFPDLDLYDRDSLDYGFSVGRQPIRLQDGMLVDDIMDSVGIVRNSLHTSWTSGIRVTALYSWNQINRDDNQLDRSSSLFALSSSIDVYTTTIDADLVYVNADGQHGDGLFGGIGATQRTELLGRTVNTTFRLLGSRALDQKTVAVGNGALLFAQLAVTPHGSNDWVYLDLFYAISRFSSAARGPEAGGPLTTTGLLYSNPELGSYGSALSNGATDSVGLALGYQMFFDAFRRQVILELGGRAGTRSGIPDQLAVGTRVEQAIGRHVLLRLDAHAAVREDLSPGFGARTELVFKF